MFVCSQCYDITTFNVIKISAKRELGEIPSEPMCLKCKSKSMVEIDDGIAEQISIFWKNGIYTQFCCSGHPFQISRPYIIFKNDDLSKLESLYSTISEIKEKYIHLKAIQNCTETGKFNFLSNMKGNQINNNYRFTMEFNDTLYIAHRNNRIVKNEFIKKFSNFLYKMINHMKLEY